MTTISPIKRTTPVSAVAFTLVLLVCTSPAEEITETYPDGTKKTVYSVNADGLKQGSLLEFYPDGKRKTLARYRLGKLHGPLRHYHPNGRVKTKAEYRNGLLAGKRVEHLEDGAVAAVETYRDGKLHGPRQEFHEGKLVADEIWHDGKLIIPKSAAQIKSQLAAIHRTQVKTVGERPPTTPEIAAAVNDPRLAAKRAEALRVLMSYRYLCDVPYEDLVLERTCNAHAEAACRLLERTGRLDHSPPNPGWPEDQYKFALRGTSDSNLHMSTEMKPSLMAGTVQHYMDDSDKRNIGRLGHRRWCINPAMLKTGFAVFGRFSAMWSLDQSRTELPEYDYVAFPPRGLTPTASFKEHFAWSVSLNPAGFRPPQADTVNVNVYPVRALTRQGDLQKSRQPLGMSYFDVSLQRMGIPNCIIFRPTGVKVKPGAAYWIEITGLQDTTGRQTKIEYLVAFFKL